MLYTSFVTLCYRLLTHITNASLKFLYSHSEPYNWQFILSDERRLLKNNKIETHATPRYKSMQVQMEKSGVTGNEPELNYFSISTRNTAFLSGSA